MIQCGGPRILRERWQTNVKTSELVANIASGGRLFWPFLRPIMVLFFMLSLSSVAGAQTLDVFTVANIPVDVTAKTAAAARMQALADGEKRAFKLLLKRLTIRIDHHRLPVLEAKEISSYVQDFGVANEKNSLVRYLANLTYRFKPRDIRFLLRDSDIPFAETRSKPILVLPVYQVAGAVSLWDDPNPWWQAWVDRSKDAKSAKIVKIDGLVPMILASGDLTDISIIGAELAVKGDEQRLAAIAKRYRVATTMVALATLSSTSRGKPVLKISIFQYGQNESRQAFSTEITAQQGEGIDALLNRAAVEIRARIEDQWKADNLLEFERTGLVAVTLPITGLKHWVDAKRRLARVAVIEKTELVLLSRNEVRLNIHYIGEAEQLKLAMVQADMVLTKDEGNWIVKLQSPVKSGKMKRVKDRRW